MALLDKLRNNKPEPDEDKQIIQQTGLIWKYLQEARRRREYDWFLNDQFYHTIYQIQKLSD